MASPLTAGAATHSGSASFRRLIKAFLNGVKTLYISWLPVITLPGASITLSSNPSQTTPSSIFSS